MQSVWVLYILMVTSSHLKFSAGVADLIDVGQRASVVLCPWLRQAKLLDLLKLDLRQKQSHVLIVWARREQVLNEKWIWATDLISYFKFCNILRMSKMSLGAHSCYTVTAPQIAFFFLCMSHQMDLWFSISLKQYRSASSHSRCFSTAVLLLFNLILPSTFWKWTERQA